MKRTSQCGSCGMPLPDGTDVVPVPIMGQNGLSTPQWWHEVCMRRQSVGSPAHLLGRCDTRCHGDGSFTYEPETPEEKHLEALVSDYLWKMGYP